MVANTEQRMGRVYYKVYFIINFLFYLVCMKPGKTGAAIRLVFYIIKLTSNFSAVVRRNIMTKNMSLLD
jgi:hypothetical protein